MTDGQGRRDGVEMWLKFDAGPVPYPGEGGGGGGFPPDSPVFLPRQKPISPNSNLARKEHLHENRLRLLWLPI